MSAVRLIERAYQSLELGRDAWLAALREEASRTFGASLTPAATFEFQLDPGAGALKTLGIAHEPELIEEHLRIHSDATPEMRRAIYLGGPCVSVRRALAAIGAPEEVIDASLAGFGDFVGAVGIDPSGHGTAVSWGTDSEKPLPRATRNAIERVAAHLAAATRLRAASRPLEAVVDRGKVVHAEGDARDASTRRALRDAALSIDRARMRGIDASDEPERLSMWRALVEGRWSLVERFESDGRRYFIARRNEPTTSAIAALDLREREVIALAAVGRPQKVIAYELGLSEPAVSAALSRALRKLGIASRGVLVELHGAIIRAPTAPEK